MSMRMSRRLGLSLAVALMSGCAGGVAGDPNGAIAGKGGAGAVATAGAAGTMASGGVGGASAGATATGSVGAAGQVAGTGGVAGAAGQTTGAGGGGKGGIATAGSSGGGSSGIGGSSPSGGRGGGAGVGGTTGTAGSAGGALDPGTDGDGDFTVGPTYTKQSDLTSKGAPAGKSFSFTMQSSDSKIYTGLDTTLTSPKAFSRSINVYVPARYKNGTAAPFMIIHDGPGALGNVKLALDNLTASSDPARRLPAFVAIAVANGGGDSLGSERGLEYDTMSDRFARFIDSEVLPAVLANAQIKAAYPNLSFTTDPEGRGSIGCSSGGAAALTMAWFRPDLFRKAITYSGTFVDQQDTDAPEEKLFPLGAWEYHSSMALIANSDPKPLRIFLNANERDNGATAPESGHHNWVMANQRTAAALKAKGYHYRYVVGQNAGHCDSNVQNATLADALIWVWRGYPIE